MLAAIDKGAEGWITLSNGVVGEGRALYRAGGEQNIVRHVGRTLVEQRPPSVVEDNKLAVKHVALGQ